ncbi:hypothetical protein [Paraburkholderia sp. J12]|uniref:hypothetical protein n=1 Tax=Paraburkholderia sp. J12 TaxID=2805432 RepID=UPI002ABD2A5E|nr:hypothetical protein [Paraburkholderia sp. J12]
MDRYWQSGAVPDAPAVPASNAGGYPANGNPAAGINGTVQGEWWYYAVSEELRNVITALGGTPEYTQVNQLAAVLANTFAQTTQTIMGQLATVATSGKYDDLLGLPDLAAVATSGQYADLAGLPGLAPVATSGNYDDLSNTPVIPPEFTLPPATTSSLGGVIAGPGTSIAADGTLSAIATLTTIIDLAAAENVALDLTPLSQGAPEILFNLLVAAGITTTLSIANPPPTGVLGAFLLVVSNGGAGCALACPTNVKRPSGSAPMLSGVAGKLDTCVFYTQDGGATFCAFIAAQDQ